jgi:3-oxoadipate enol-lactonase
MPYADLPDVRLHYQLDGDERLPVLVLSNSLGTNLDIWNPQVADFTRLFRVLRYDTRGHGLSSVPRGPYDIAQLGTDVIHLMDHLGIGRASFCGLSMGGITGMWLALAHPARIDRLVLCNTAAYIGPPENWTNRAATVERDGVTSIAPAVVDKWLTPEFAAQNPDLVTYLQTMLGATSAPGYSANCLAVRDADLRDEIRRIACPTLVISGSKDLPTPPRDGAYLAQTIPAARYTELEAAHISNVEQSRAFSQAVLEFMLQKP